MQYLLFQLYGALQAWGSACPGNTRPTEDHPTKSGVLGLVSACLGIKSEEIPKLENLYASTGFACRMDIPGIPLEDFHTVRHEGRETYKEFDDPIVSWRYYLMGALFTVCLWKKTPNEELGTVASSLNKPKFMPYLGRSTCIQGLPFDPLLVKAKNLKEAFGQYVADSHRFLLALKASRPRIFWEGEDSSLQVIGSRYRYDVPKNRVSRTFTRRLEYEGRL